MYKKNTTLNLSNMLIVVGLQLILLSFLFFLVYIRYDLNVALSGFYGGLVSVFSTVLFFIVFFFKNGDMSPKFIIKKFYFAGFLKLVLLILVFSFLFKIGLYSPICFFIFLFLIQLSFWFGYFYFFMGI